MTLYNVMHEEPWVGSFYQGSFSTRELAQNYIDQQEDNDGYWSIETHVLDGGI